MSKGERIADKEHALKVAKKEIAEINDMIDGLAKQREAAQRRAHQLENDLRQMKPPDLIVTDHAVLRYLERAHYINVEEVRSEMKSMLGGAVHLGGDMRVSGFVIKNNTVITYYPPGNSNAPS